MNTFPAEIQERINSDLASLTPSSVKGYTQYGFMTLLAYANSNNLPLSVITVKNFSVHLQKLGKSSAQASLAFGGLKMVLAAHDKTISPQGYQLYKTRIRNHSKVFASRQTRKFRYPISAKDATKLLKNKPPHCALTVWESFVTLAWVFMLRSNEVKNTKSSDLRLKHNDKGKPLGWILTVRNNKNCANKAEGRNIYFPFKDIPEQFLPILEKFAGADDSVNLVNLPSSSKIIEHLRTVLKVGKQFVIVVHSFRHGRPEHLVNVRNYDEAKLMRVARWSTQKGRRAYQHS